jgi:hypothetical protein
MRVLFYSICSLAILPLILPISCSTKKKEEQAYRALMRIEAMVESGMNLEDYGKAITQAKLEINLLKGKSPNIDQFQEIYNYYQIAMILSADLVKAKIVYPKIVRWNRQNDALIDLKSLYKHASIAMDTLKIAREINIEKGRRERVRSLFADFDFELKLLDICKEVWGRDRIGRLGDPVDRCATEVQEPVQAFIYYASAQRDLLWVEASNLLRNYEQR